MRRCKGIGFETVTVDVHTHSIARGGIHGSLGATKPWGTSAGRERRTHLAGGAGAQEVPPPHPLTEVLPEGFAGGHPVISRGQPSDGHKGGRGGGSGSSAGTRYNGDGIMANKTRTMPEKNISSRKLAEPSPGTGWGRLGPKEGPRRGPRPGGPRC